MQIQPIEPDPNDWGILEEPLLPMGDNFDSVIIHPEPANTDRGQGDAESGRAGSGGTWANPTYSPEPTAPRFNDQAATRSSEKFELTPIAIVTEPDPDPNPNPSPVLSDQNPVAAEESTSSEPSNATPATAEKSEEKEEEQERELTAAVSTLKTQIENVEPEEVKAIEPPPVQEQEQEPEPVMATTQSPAPIAEREQEYHDSTLEKSGNDSKGGLLGFMSRIFKS